MVQCKCKTNDGSRCKRAANPKSDHHYCTQHENSDKMRCVSLARESIGYFSPAQAPGPRHYGEKKKSPKKSKKSPKSKKSKSRK